jgi:phage gp36-like protein
MNGLVLQLIILIRFVCFIALFYLMLHILVSRIIKRPEHKVLWFFSVLTGPLTRPVRVLVSGDVPEQRLRWIALMFYGVLWLVAIALTGLLSGSSPQSV